MEEELEAIRAKYAGMKAPLYTKVRSPASQLGVAHR